VAPPAIGRIRQRRLFGELSRTTHRAAQGPVRAAYVPAQSGLPFPLVAYVVSKRCGNAVARNRIRRRMRAAAAAAAPELRRGAYLISSRPEVATCNYEELAAAVRSVLVRAASTEESR
jgi:ribonuclease P protein component